MASGSHSTTGRLWPWSSNVLSRWQGLGLRQKVPGSGQQLGRPVFHHLSWEARTLEQQERGIRLNFNPGPNKRMKDQLSDQPSFLSFP